MIVGIIVLNVTGATEVVAQRGTADEETLLSGCNRRAECLEEAAGH